MSGRPAVMGAYGLALDGVAEAAAHLVVAEPDWPRFELVNTVGHVERTLDRINDDRALLRLRSGGEIRVIRADSTAEFVTPQRLTPDELVHPYLAPVAAVAAHWFGRDSFHGGAFAVGQDIWAVVGDREGGKSTTLAWLASQGIPVVCDDLLVIESETTFAGPRMIDLRAESAERLGAGVHLGVVGARERWRLLLGAPPDGARLQGWIFLAWGDEISVERVSAAECLPRLFEHLGLRIPPARPERILELASLPAWEFRRPPGWDRFEEAGRRLLETLAR